MAPVLDKLVVFALEHAFGCVAVLLEPRPNHTVDSVDAIGNGVEVRACANDATATRDR
jgi:hypothetical protein